MFEPNECAEPETGFLSLRPIWRPVFPPWPPAARFS